MMLRNYLKRCFCKTSNIREQLKQLDLNIEIIRKQYCQLQNKPLDADVHTKLLEKATQLDFITQKKKKLRDEEKKQQELKIVKQYLNSKVVEPQKAQQARYIPTGLTLNKLQYKKSSVLLVGIDKMNEQHGIFVQNLADRLEIQLLMTQLPPDWPYFIKTTGSFQIAWKKFVTRTSEFSFYLNPKPETLSHLILDKTKIPLFKQTLLKSDNFEQLTGICLELDTDKNKFQTNSFLCGLFCTRLQNILCFDYPILRERQYQALTMSIQTLRQLFNTYLYSINDKKHNFDPRLIHYQKMLKPKIQYMTRVIKLGSLMYPKTIAVCDSQYSHFICEEWKNNIPTNKKIFDFPGEEKLKGQKKRGFLQHLQKLIILDIILSPLIRDHFIKFKSFPYSCHNFIGKNEIMPALNIVWDFYSKKYTDAIENVSPVNDPIYPQKL